jgi:hypothetical protein
MLDPFDKSNCSFAVPEFESEEQERGGRGRGTVARRTRVAAALRVSRHN